LECALVGLAAWGLYRWRQPPPEPQAPAYANGRPDLDMTGAAPTLRAPKAADSMLVQPESLSDGPPGLHGRAPKPRPLGSTPRLLGPGARDEAAAPPPDDESARSAWLRRLARFGGPRAVAEIFGLFVVGYLLLARGLRRGSPHSLTHD
jgi:hypothetical protein